MSRRTGAAVASTVAGVAAVLGLHASHPASGSSAPTTSTTVPSSSQPSAPSPPPGASVSAVGTSEQFGYGVLSVKATARGHRLVDVTVTNLQTAESYSQSLAQQLSRSCTARYWRRRARRSMRYRVPPTRAKRTSTPCSLRSTSCTCDGY